MITGTSDRWRRLWHTAVPGGPGSMRSSSTRSAPSWLSYLADPATAG
jgi:hypothetical protein